MRLKDKVALFAGAGSNMSRASALLFAQEVAWVTGLELTIDGGDSLFIDSPARREVLA